ncbi:YARHG domain-containing protein [Flavobacterium sp. I3-2]|uniref:YARHG domain-containing protein n=1 Tax=Flavobacterium sp. I3-2 TaxID=2748319 RepID=UPI0015ABDCD3|nr:YARHG domain-containing protein [Flavobacterium sp. I3-2]
MKNYLFFILFSISQNIFSQNLTDCSNCNSVILKEKQLTGKSLEELALLRNEIFARKGYNFSSDRLTRYFETKKWYKKVDSNQIINFS